MKLEDFLRLSVLPQMQVTSLYLKPDIPQDKLANAIREYAPTIGMSTVVVLVDETFWGNAKEGMIITNEKIILSKKLGGRVIPLTSVNNIEIKDKNLIVNDLPLAKLSNPEVMPLTAFGAMLNEFVLASKNSTGGLKSPTVLDESTTEKLTSFLARFTEPMYFESAPTAQRKPGATTPSFVLAATITEEQRELLRFKGRFASNEEILCASWLDSHSEHYYFCVTNCGVFSIMSGGSMAISHDDLRNLSAVEEYKEGRYIGLRLSDGQGIIVSIQNVYVRPYAHELFVGLINILNGRKPAMRITERDVNQQASNTAHPLPDSSLQPEHKDATTKVHGDVKQQELVQNGKSPIPFRIIDRDRLFESIIQINSIDNVSEFIGSLGLSSEKTNSNIRKKFQSYVARSTTSFRKEVVENGAFSQFKNDVATMEICGAAMALAFLQMQERGVNEDLAIRILFEGIRATFNLKASAQSDPTGVALIKIVESYVPDGDGSLNDIVLNIVLRLIGSNLSGRLFPDYSEILEDYANLLQNFVPIMSPSFNIFANKMMSESRLLVDDILDARW